MCGLAAWGTDLFPVQALVDLIGADVLTDEASVTRFIEAAIDDLFAEDMRFMPLLPEDDTPMALRLEALGLWCGGFLAGLGAGFGAGSAVAQDPQDLPEQAQEIVEDFAAIAEIDVESSGAGSREQAEAELAELQEFVKVGALLLASLLTYGTDDQAG